LINCQQAREYMSLQLDEVLEKSLTDQLEEHLHQCDSCTNYMSRLESLHLQLSNMPDVSLEESIVDRLIATEKFSKKEADKSINKLSSFPFKKKLLPWYGVAVAAIIAISFIPSVLLPNSGNEIADQELAVRNPDEIPLVEPRIEKTPKINQNDNSEQIGPQMSIMAEENSSFSAVPPIQIEVQENQLIISKDQQEIYRTNKWSDDLTIQWEIVNDDTVNYFLYNNIGEQVKAYQINLITKQEEIFIN